uniref:Peptidase M12A domain-containing protein n=1 Tax=Plectus sambesii TaxID=2011161 RepID=A0A914V1X0_9BILA
MDDKFNRTLMYMSTKSLNQANDDLSRGIVLHELCRVLGLEHENDRLEAAQYLTFESSESLSNKATEFRSRKIRQAPDSQRWPFDPTSVTIFEPNEPPKSHYRLTSQCNGSKTSDIAKGLKIGRLSFWDVVKINSLYCPDHVPAKAAHTPGPCEKSFRRRLAGVRLSKRPMERNRLRKVMGRA